MKRWLSILLLLSLLSGCSTALPNATDPSQPSAPTPGADQDEAEKLLSIPLEEDRCAGLLPMGQDLLLVEKDRLTLLDGATLSLITSESHLGLPEADSGHIWARADSVAYYHEVSNSILFLNTHLRQTRKLDLPEDMVGAPWLSPDWNTVYYTTQTAIRGLDLRTGISRMLKEQGSAWQSITGVFRNGSALRCEVTLADGSTRVSLISTENGTLLQEDAALSTLVDGGDWFFLTPTNTCVPQLIFGKTKDTLRYLWPKEQITGWWPLTEQGLIVTARDTEETTVLDCYSMESDKRFAVLYLPEKTEVQHICSAGNGILWLCGTTAVYRWDTAWSLTVDHQDYTTPLYSRDDPDEAGLAALEAAISKLEQRYGIDIILGAEAAGVTPQSYTFETEYIPQAFDKALANLAETLAQFPDNFFTLAADRAPGKKLTIVLVRNIYSGTEMAARNAAGGIQYWLNNDPYIALSLSDNLSQNFFHTMGHVIDSRVLSTSAAFYEWHAVNPPGFQYDKDYIKNLDRDETQYLQGDDRWFIDTYSMSFEIEDRSRIFEYASQPGNEAYFTSAHMQAKLKRICNGIRQVFGLKNDSRQFIWEQYLQK